MGLRFPCYDCKECVRACDQIISKAKIKSLLIGKKGLREKRRYVESRPADMQVSTVYTRERERGGGGREKKGEFEKVV